MIGVVRARAFIGGRRTPSLPTVLVHGRVKAGPLRAWVEPFILLLEASDVCASTDEVLVLGAPKLAQAAVACEGDGHTVIVAVHPRCCLGGGSLRIRMFIVTPRCNARWSQAWSSRVQHEKLWAKSTMERPLETPYIRRHQEAPRELDRAWHDLRRACLAGLHDAQNSLGSFGDSTLP